MDPELRDDFPILTENPELIYLDNAATTQKPGSVIERVKEFYEKKNSNVGRGLYDLANTATKEYREARKTVADFVGARSDEMVFVRNTTEAENLLASSLELEGNIVVPEMAHHSEQLPWRRKAEGEDLDIRYIPTEDNKLDLEAAKRIIDCETSLVSVPHISNVFGCKVPVEELAEITHEKNALISVDGAQSVPRIKTDVKDLGVDFLSFSGHKMLGPNGIGALYGRKELLEGMSPYQVGGGMIETVSKKEVKWNEAPSKFEAGTPNVSGAVGLAEAVKYLEKIGMEKVGRHDRELCRKMIEGLRRIEGVNVLEPAGQDPYVVSFTMDSAHPHDIAEVLNRNNVAVRAGHHCAHPQMNELEVNGTVRASPYLYNTGSDVEKLLEAVKKVKTVFG